jgi:hypothetical protein
MVPEDSNTADIQMSPLKKVETLDSQRVLKVDKLNS